MKGSKHFFHVSVVMLFIMIAAFQGFCDRLDFSKKSNGYSLKTSGALIEKLEQNVAVVKLASPNATVELENINGELHYRLKIINISPVKYSISPAGDEKREKGTRYVELYLSIPAGEKKVFEIKPKLENPDNFTFALLGDSRHGTHIHKKILGMIAGTDAIFAINTGDIVNHGYEGEYQSFNREISGFPLPYFVAIGNHEVVHRQGHELFQKYVGPTRFSFRQGKFNFIFLDNSNSRLNREQFDWLENQLKNNENNAVFMHMPPFSPVERYKNHTMNKDDSTAFMDMAKKYKLKIAAFGHIHGYNKTVKDGVTYILAACAGASPYLLPHEGGFYHYVLIKVTGDGFESEVVKVNPF